MELGEEKKFNLTEDVAVIAADASVNRLDQPGIITLQKVEEECNRFKDIGDNPIYIRVFQEDGTYCWSSPIYIYR